MNYLALLPFDIRQYIYNEYLCVPKQLALFWSKLPALANCKSKVNEESEPSDATRILAFYFIHEGYLSLVKWMHLNGYIYDDDSVSYAAGAGQLAILQWLLANTKGKMTVKTMAMAVTCGHLHILQFLLQEGCPIHANASLIARTYGHKHILQWLMDAKPVKSCNGKLVLPASYNNFDRKANPEHMPRGLMVSESDTLKYMLNSF